MSAIVSDIRRIISDFLSRLCEDLDPDVKQILSYFDAIKAIILDKNGDILASLMDNMHQRGACLALGLLAGVHPNLDSLFELICTYTKSTNLYLKQEAFFALGLLSLKRDFVKGEEILIEALNSRTADEYALRGAIFGLAFTNQPSKGALAILIQFLEDENPWLRRAACLGLVALIIRNNIQTPDILRSKASIILGIIEASKGDLELGQFFLVLSLVEDMNYEKVLQTVISPLDLEQFYSLIRNALKDTDKDVKRAATYGIALLRSLKDPIKLYAFLNSLLKSSVRGIKQGACIGLGLLASTLDQGSSHFIDHLLFLARYSQEPVLIQSALFSLGIAFNHLEEEEISFLRKKLETSDTFSLRAICTGLGSIGGKKESIFLNKIILVFSIVSLHIPSLLSHSDSWVKRATAFLLSGLELSFTAFSGSKSDNLTHYFLIRIFSLSFALFLFDLGDYEASLFLLCSSSS
ncbi:MAG: HEAT repeat domain-containing protein [Candidatus Hodarchaeota archaeon]